MKLRYCQAFRISECLFYFQRDKLSSEKLYLREGGRGREESYGGSYMPVLISDNANNRGASR